MSVEIRLRRGTAAQWAAANPVLALAEPGYETDTRVLKLGNGVTAWNSLPAVSDEEAQAILDEARAARDTAAAHAGAAEGAASSTDTVMAARIADPNSQTRPAVAGVVDTAIDDADVLKGDQHRAPKTGKTDAFRVRDTSGRVALEVDADGRTHIYDPGNSTPVTTLHVFIAAGQSNMAGAGLPLQGPTSPRVMQYGANRRVLEEATVPLDMVNANPSGTSPATFFARNYLASQPAHVGVLLIPSARSATAFMGSPENPATSWTWTKGAASEPQYALYERSVTQTQEAIAAAEAAGYQVVLKGVLWHQGEGNHPMTEAVYAQHLDQLVADYRADLDHETLPFVVGQMCREGMVVQPNKYRIDAAHRDTPARVTGTGFAPSALNAHNPGDTTHFSTAGMAYLGDTYVTGYTQALGNVHPN